ncbi:hypothetical protein G1H11_01525 [Phytoactinopolyspora alkaliphila]|uniref:ABC3 transporter permease C-terminal domain-containing protein n=1 Tax=Phytoactinopolyspora alkaliphila TaxID=1783498 RepID=A0A6N9YG71_9ACTN|nr:hypothetical protein [Phytoactinopolyspora alkaliphila]
MLLGQTRSEATESLREVLTADETPAPMLQISAQRAQDAAVQDTAVKEQLRALLPGVGFEVYRSYIAQQPAPISRGMEHERPPRVMLSAYDDVERHVRVVDGAVFADSSRQDGTIAALVHATAAAELDLEPGSAITIGDEDTGARLEVVGTWLPDDPSSGFWRDELERSGSEDAVLGPVLIAEQDFPTVVTRSTARWRMVLDPAATSIEDVAVLGAGLRAVRPRLGSDERITSTFVTVDGELPDVIDEFETQLMAARAVSASATALLVAMSFTATWLVAALLITSRSSSTVLLRARGATVRQIGGWAGIEALMVSVPAAVVAMPVSIGVLILLGSEPKPHTWSAQPWNLAAVAALAVAFGVAAVMTGLAVRTAARSLRDSVGARTAGSSGRWIGAGTGALAVVAAAVAVWQLRRYRSPIITDARGQSAVDPLVVLAPALALVAGGMVALALLPLISRIVERLVALGRGLGWVWPAWQVSRRMQSYIAPVLLVAVAAGAGTLGIAYTTTWERLQRDLGGIEAGADVRVDVPARGGRLDDDAAGRWTAQPYRDLAGVAAVAPVWAGDVAVRDEGLTVISAPAASFAEVSAASENVADASWIASTLGARTSHPPGLTVPEDADVLELTLDAAVRRAPDVADEYLDESSDPGEGQVELRLWLIDRDGAVTSVATETVGVPFDDEAGIHQVVRVTMPSGVRPWTLAAMDLTLSPASGMQRFAYGYDVAVAGIRATGADGSATVMSLVDVADWGAELPVNSAVPAALSRSGSPGIGVSTGPVETRERTTVRLMPAGQDEPIPVVLSAEASRVLGLSAGADLALRIAGVDVGTRVAGTTSAVPGTLASMAAVVDLPSMMAALLRETNHVPSASQVWIGLAPDSEPGMVTTAVAAVAGTDALVTARDASETLMPYRTGMSGAGVFGIAALAMTALMALGCAAAWTVARRQRHADVTALRALGMSPRAQGWSTVAEQLCVIFAAMAVGAAAGRIVAGLVVAPMAGATTPRWPDGLEMAVDVAWAPLLGYLTTLTVILAVVAVRHGAGVASEARRPPERAE